MKEKEIYIANVNASADLAVNLPTKVYGDTNVLTRGNVSADAKGETPSTSVTGIKVGVYSAKAYSNAKQYANASFSENLVTAGDFNVKSLVDSSKANALVGASGNSDSVTLASGDSNTAYADEVIYSKATVANPSGSDNKYGVKVDPSALKQNISSGKGKISISLIPWRVCL